MAVKVITTQSSVCHVTPAAVVPLPLTSLAKSISMPLTVFWSLAYVDWYQDNQPTDEQAFAKLLPRIHPGAVVLLHSTSQTNARILDTLLTKWEEMGYTFGTLDELYA